ncbi:hypothetical protein B9Z45_05660 [Limnohabitans sp. 2KL-17]|nr:hypothetical protein B9Z45_05660 [Limnohabitans sp. 2KL-17]
MSPTRLSNKPCTGVAMESTRSSTRCERVLPGLPSMGDNLHVCDMRPRQTSGIRSTKTPIHLATDR